MSQSTKPRPAKRRRVSNQKRYSLRGTALDVPPASTHSDSGNNFEPLFQQHGEQIDTKTLLLGTIETSEGAIRLANALRDRRVRRALSGLGVKVQHPEDIGYTSLPFELRAEIRNIVIEDLQRDEAANQRRRCCRRMASYACVDREWQAAIEAVTFRTIRLSNHHNELQQELDNFVRYIVGHRRQYVQEVGISCAAEWEPRHLGEHLQSSAIYISTYSIFQLFNCIKSWGDQGCRSLTVRLDESSIFKRGWEVEQSIEDLVSELAHLPILPNVSTFYWSFTIPAEGLLTILSSFPRLRHTSMTPASISFLEWEDKYHTHSYRRRIEFFFTILATTVPSLEVLEFHTQQRNGNMRCSEDDINDALIYYSQDLHFLSLRGLDQRAVLNCFKPFSTQGIASDAPPPLSWPLLTYLYIDKLRFPPGSGSVSKLIPLVRRIGRAVRNMPRIVSIIMGVEELEPRSLEWNTLKFELSVTRGGVNRASLAVLTVSHTQGFRTQAHNLIHEGYLRLWGKSLREGANAGLQVHFVNSGSG